MRKDGLCFAVISQPGYEGNGFGLARRERDGCRESAAAAAAVRLGAAQITGRDACRPVIVPVRAEEFVLVAAA